MTKFKRISVFIKSKKEPEYKNVGWFRTESELLAIYPYPHKGDYCYIGVSLINSFIFAKFLGAKPKLSSPFKLDE